MAHSPDPHAPNGDEPPGRVLEPGEHPVEEALDDTPSMRPALLSRPRWLTRPRLRLLSAVGTVVVFVLALSVVLSTIPGFGAGTRGLVFGPTPTATTPLFPGDDQFYVAPGPTWARVTLDGRRLATLPAFGTSAPLRLARGRHTFTWQAAPFADQRCTVSVPARGAPYDTCAIDRVLRVPTTINQPPRSANFWVIELYPSLRELPQPYQADLTHEIETLLGERTSSDTVRPGEGYLADDGVHRATQPLTAVLSLSFDTNVDPQATCLFTNEQFCEYLGRDCRSLCTVPELGLPAIGGPPVWTVLAAAQEYWQYSDQHDQQVGVWSSADFGPSDLPVPLTITWDGAAWHVTVSYAQPIYAFMGITAPDEPAVHSPACWLMAGGVGPNGSPGAFGGPTDQRYMNLTWRFAPGPVPAAGCAAEATPPPPVATSGTPTPLPPADFIERFGVLLAANGDAQRLWPLPAATPAESRLAAAWLDAPPPSSG